MYLQRDHKVKQRQIEDSWLKLEATDRINPDILHVLQDIMSALDKGQLQICHAQKNGEWHVEMWLKKALLLYMKLTQGQIHKTDHNNAFDKVPLKFANWTVSDFIKDQIRVVPGAIVRLSAHIGTNCIIMPSFINIGTRIGRNTMIDSNVTIGSCAYIGQNCHIGSGTVIGGVLEPLQAWPVIIEDNVFIGANSSLVEGIIVGQGSVIASGVSISSVTKIYNRQTKEIMYGRIPPHSVVVPGTIPDTAGTCFLNAAIIVKNVDTQTRANTAINDLLRSCNI